MNGVSQYVVKQPVPANKQERRGALQGLHTFTNDILHIPLRLLCTFGRVTKLFLQKYDTAQNQKLFLFISLNNCHIKKCSK
jgi:hypothetical protein